MSGCSFFGGTLDNIDFKNILLLNKTFEYLILIENVRAFYTYGDTEFEELCLDILENQAKICNLADKIETVKILKPKEKYQITCDSPFDSVIKQKTSRINRMGKSIVQFSDFIIFDSVKKEKPQYDLYINIITDAILYNKRPKIIILDKAYKKAQDE